MSPTGQYPEPDPVRSPSAGAKPTSFNFDKFWGLVFFLLFLLVVIYQPFAGSTGPREEPSVAAERQERASAERQERASAIQADCRRIEQCSEYADARQSCAAAGSYTRCMNIRLGEQSYFTAAIDCSNGGRPLYFRTGSEPSRFTCLMNLLGL